MLPFLDEERREAHKLRNLLHSGLLVVGLGLLLAVCAWLIWGWTGILWAFLLVGLILFLAPRVSPATIMRMYRAVPVDPKHGAQLYRIVAILADRAELPGLPRLFVIPSATLNAFATGSPDNAYVAVTEGLLRRLNLREITGVIAHEMSHIRNNDLWIMGLADMMSRITQLLSFAGLFLLLLNLPFALLGKTTISWLAALLLYLAPTIGSFLQLALSRAREYDADLEGAQLTGDPEGLASALNKLERYQGRFWEELVFPGRRIPYPSILRSHPSTQERVRRLLELRPKLPPVTVPNEPIITMVGSGPAKLHPRYHWPWPGVWY